VVLYKGTLKMQDKKMQEWKRNLKRNTNDTIVMLFSRHVTSISEQNVKKT